MFNFRNGFFLLLGFSAGYYKGIQHGTKAKEIIEELRNDPNFHEIVEELKRTVKNANEKAEQPEDIEGEAVDVADYANIDRDKYGATSRYPAFGTALPTERQDEINLSTPENPVTLTDDEINAMNLNYVKVGLGSGRFKVVNADGVVTGREDLPATSILTEGE